MTSVDKKIDLNTIAALAAADAVRLNAFATPCARPLTKAPANGRPAIYESNVRRDGAW